MAIVAEPNVIVDDILDTFGRGFAYDHPKGLAEWIKNSVDAYMNAEVKDEEQVLLVELDERKPKKTSIFKIIDFAGMTCEDIEQAFKRWGDTKAAKRNARRRKATLGGHGNGGKFYMRQGFETSYFVTYKNGRLSIYGFNKEKQYGFEKNRRDVEMSLEDALLVADINVDELPDIARHRLQQSQGFTVVVGRHPQNFQTKATARKLLGKLTDHPQARRLIAHRPVFARINATAPWTRLVAKEPEPRPDFAEEIVTDIPMTLTNIDGDEHVLRDSEYPEASLILNTSKESLRHSGADRIDIIGEIGVLASYSTAELGLRYAPQGEFIHGECFCPKLEDPDESCVENEREKLVNNPKARTLLAWVRDRVDELAQNLGEADAKEKQAADLSQSSAFNELLNQWKNQFMPTLMAQLFGGPGEGSGFGGDGSGSGGGGGDERGPVDPDPNPEPNPDPDGGGDEGGAGGEKKTGPRAPTVLLSNFDADPLDLMAPPVVCSERQPAVYQRYQDVAEGIYWINTQRPMADRIIRDFGVESTRWRDYLFQRYQEIILKESIRQLEKRQGELSADLIDQHIDELYTKLQDQAYDDLQDFLFDEKLAA